MTEQTEAAEVEVARAAATLYDEVRAAVIAEPIGSLARRLHTALGNLAHAVLTSEPAAVAEVEALAEALSSPGFVNAITDAVDGAFRNPPPPSTLHDDAHPIAIADAAVGAARDYLLASDWLAADRAAAEARGAEREKRRLAEMGGRYYDVVDNEIAESIRNDAEYAEAVRQSARAEGAARALREAADDALASPSTRLGDLHPGEIWADWLRARAAAMTVSSEKSSSLATRVPQDESQHTGGRPVTAPDFASVLAEVGLRPDDLRYVLDSYAPTARKQRGCPNGCGCTDCEMVDDLRALLDAAPAHRAHVAAALHAELLAWLGSEAALKAASNGIYRRRTTMADSRDLATAALAALAQAATDAAL